MSSYVERVLDFLEKQAENPQVPKALQEDLEWAIQIITQNRLYAGDQKSFNFSEERPEVKAWTDLINMKNIPQNIKELERLKQYEILEQEKIKQNKRRGNLKKDANSKKRSPQHKDSNLAISIRNIEKKDGPQNDLDPLELEFL